MVQLYTGTGSVSTETRRFAKAIAFESRAFQPECAGHESGLAHQGRVPRGCEWDKWDKICPKVSHFVSVCPICGGFWRWFVAEFCHTPRGFSNTVPKCPIPNFCSTGMPHADSERDRIVALSSHHGNIVRWCNKGRQASSVIKSSKCDCPGRFARVF